MATTEQVKVWDPLVRIFHWTLVLSFTVAYFTAEEESAWHIYSGYTVIGLVLFRILWGLIGTKHARFSDFIYPPKVILAYTRGFLARRPDPYLGHNPLGGIMVVALLLVILATTVTGLMVYAIEENAGPLAGFAVTDGPTPIASAHADELDGEEAREEFWEELHELFTNLALILIALHILGAIAASRVHGENLVKAMITGRKRRLSNE